MTSGKKKDKVRKSTINLNEIPVINWGGYLPHPPSNCPNKNKQFQDKGTVWIDLSNCHACDIKKECTRRKEYLIILKGEK